MYLLFITFWSEIGSIIRVFGSEDDRVDPFGPNCGSVVNVDDSDDGIVVYFCLFDGWLFMQLVLIMMQLVTFGLADVSVVIVDNSEDWAIVITIDYSVCWGDVLMLDFFF